MTVFGASEVCCSSACSPVVLFWAGADDSSVDTTSKDRGLVGDSGREPEGSCSERSMIGWEEVAWRGPSDALSSRSDSCDAASMVIFAPGRANDDKTADASIGFAEGSVSGEGAADNIIVEMIERGSGGLTVAAVVDELWDGIVVIAERVIPLAPEGTGMEPIIVEIGNGC